ncbi:MAG: hypothetical protein CMF57_11415, partial [Leifsonia sp.]|nr:hypothetical protein [Leifsonia sp.]
ERDGLVVVEAVDGQDALDVLTRSDTSIDAIVTDLTMPRRDGRSLAAWVAKYRSTVPVIVTSGSHDAAESMVRGQVHAVLRKPYPPSALRDAVRSALATEAAAS